MKPRVFKEQFPKEGERMEGVVAAQLSWLKNFGEFLSDQQRLDLYRLIRSCMREVWINGYFSGKREHEKKD